MNTIVQDEIVHYYTDDGRLCNLIHVHGKNAPSRGPVLLVHGAGVRANIFRPPVATTFVDALLEHGYDVWLENWRASIDFEPNEWTLDQAAFYDHPAAVRMVLECSGASTLKAVIHCQGSTSFMMAAVAGLLPQVTTIVSNAVSLHPIVPWISRQKLRYSVPLVSTLTPYLNAQWGEHAHGCVPKLLQALVLLTHHECGNGVCRFASFTYGTGFPVLWRHENLNEKIHAWIGGEFAHVPMSFFRQMARCVAVGHLVSSGEGLPSLPEDYTLTPPKTEARIAFIAGELNKCFIWQSQLMSYNWFDRYKPNFHSLRVLNGYGHLDIFIGQHAARDTFPVLLAELDQPNL